MQNLTHARFTELVKEHGLDGAEYIVELEVIYHLSHGQWDDALLHFNVLSSIREAI